MLAKSITELVKEFGREFGGFPDLHTHTFFSDGELIPSELANRFLLRGGKILAITDHADSSNCCYLIERLRKFKEGHGRSFEERGLEILIGVELTHIPPADIPKCIEKARKEGAEIVVVHGETPVEPVPEGTNIAAIEGKADVLAHPGFIRLKHASLAVKYGVALEITTRKGHCYTNGYVLRVARKSGAPVVINTDTHSVSDIASWELLIKVGLGAGMTEEEVKRAIARSFKIASKRKGV